MNPDPLRRVFCCLASKNSDISDTDVNIFLQLTEFGCMLFPYSVRFSLQPQEIEMSDSSTPASPASHPNKPNTDLSLNQYTGDNLILNNQRPNEGQHDARVCAYSSAIYPGSAYITTVIESNGFEVRSSSTPEAARALAAALIEAADLCDAFEAAQCMAEERETARINAGPVNGIARIALPGGVIAFEDVSEAAA